MIPPFLAALAPADGRRLVKAAAPYAVAAAVSIGGAALAARDGLLRLEERQGRQYEALREEIQHLREDVREVRAVLLKGRE